MIEHIHVKETREMVPTHLRVTLSAGECSVQYTLNTFGDLSNENPVYREPAMVTLIKMHLEKQMKEWLHSLNERQVRALASQCGYEGWREADLLSLLNALAVSDKAKMIFKDNYGKATSVQE